MAKPVGKTLLVRPVGALHDVADVWVVFHDACVKDADLATGRGRHADLATERSRCVRVCLGGLSAVVAKGRRRSKEHRTDSAAWAMPLPAAQLGQTV
eukprot:362714-Chlamydomonas_euryale.AAC.3